MPKVATLTVTDPVNAGGESSYFDANGLQDFEFLIESSLTQAADIYVRGAEDSTGTSEQNLGGGKKLTLAAGDLTAQKGILSLSTFPGFLAIFVDPAANATGTVTARVMAAPRRR